MTSTDGRREDADGAVEDRARAPPSRAPGRRVARARRPREAEEPRGALLEVGQVTRAAPFPLAEGPP